MTAYLTVATFLFNVIPLINSSRQAILEMFWLCEDDTSILVNSRAKPSKLVSNASTSLMSNHRSTPQKPPFLHSPPLHNVSIGYIVSHLATGCNIKNVFFAPYLEMFGPQNFSWFRKIHHEVFTTATPSKFWNTKKFSVLQYMPQGLSHNQVHIKAGHTAFKPADWILNRPTRFSREGR